MKQLPAIADLAFFAKHWPPEGLAGIWPILPNRKFVRDGESSLLSLTIPLNINGRNGSLGDGPAPGPSKRNNVVEFLKHRGTDVKPNEWANRHYSNWQEPRLYCRVPASAQSRLGYIDWLRGLACVLMFQTHCYDAWLGGSARDSTFAMWSHLGGTFPAPLFLFLSGISVALITDKMMQKGIAPGQIGKKVITRGAQILGLGFLFRLQEYAISWGWAPWTDVFRVDVLNTIGLSIMLMGAMCWIVIFASTSREGPLLSAPQGGPSLSQDGSPGNDAVKDPSPGATAEGSYTLLFTAALVAAIAISALTPLLWTSWRPNFLPWELESYVNGVHNLGTPQPWLFPILPWTGFAFAGLALGFVVTGRLGKIYGGWLFLLAGIFGIALIYAAKFTDSLRWQLYPVYDYWHTSPAFFATRVGLLLMLVLAAYAWCRWGLGQVGFSPLIQLGKTSLLVYWVHIELVYGRFHILPPRSQTILGASRGLLIIFISMLALSIARTAWKARRHGVLSLRKHRPAASQGA